MPTEARKYVGVPWVHQGRHPEHGLDCVGLVVLYLRARGIESQDRSDYGRDPDGSLRAELIRSIGSPVAEGRGSSAHALPGDVVIIEYAPRVPRHVAIVSEFNGQPYLIHSDSAHGRVVEHPIDDRWARRIVGVWRL